jgi:hypothetical protein
MASSINRCKTCIFWQRETSKVPVQQFRRGTPERGARICQVRVTTVTTTQKNGEVVTREIPTWQTHLKNGDPMPAGPKTGQRTGAQDVCKFYRGKVRTRVTPKPIVSEQTLAGDNPVIVADELEPAE